MDKKITGILLVAFALAGLGTWVWRNFGAPSRKTPATAESAIPSTAKAVVYYFRTNYRCATCMKFEKYTGEALTASFAAPMSKGELVFQSVNVEEAGNEHFVQDYGLNTKSVVLVAPGGKPRWKNLEKIWDEVGSEVGYKRYIQTEVTAFLAGAS